MLRQCSLLATRLVEMTLFGRWFFLTGRQKEVLSVPSLLQSAHHRMWPRSTGSELLREYAHSSNKKGTSIASGKNVALRGREKEIPSGTTKLFFPWRNMPFVEFPEKSALAHPGCGRISRKFSLGAIEYLCKHFSQKEFNRDQFAREISHKVIALTKAFDEGNTEGVAGICSEGIGSVLCSAAVAMPKQGINVKLELLEPPRVRVAGGTILAFNTREDPRVFLRNGVDAARMKATVMSPPFMRYLHVIRQDGQSRSLMDSSAYLFRVYAHIQTREVFYWEKDGVLLHGSKDARDSAHVITLQTILRTKPQKMQGTGFYDDDGWRITDLDLMLLKSNMLRTINK